MFLGMKDFAQILDKFTQILSKIAQMSPNFAPRKIVRECGRISCIPSFYDTALCKNNKI